MTIVSRQADSNDVQLRLVSVDETAEPKHHESWQSALSSHYTMVPNGLLRGELDLTNDELMMLFVLRSWVPGDATGSVTINRRGGIRVPNLATWANQSERQAYRSLRMLEERGYVTIEQHTGVPSTYTVHLDEIARHLAAPPETAPASAPATTPSVKPGLKTNIYPGRCKRCSRKLGVGEGVMRGKGPECIDCGVPSGPLDGHEPGLLFGKYKSAEEHARARKSNRQR